MKKKDSKILDELRRSGKIFEDPCPMPVGFLGKLIDLFSKKKSWFVKKKWCGVGWKPSPLLDKLEIHYIGTDVFIRKKK